MIYAIKTVKYGGHSPDVLKYEHSIAKWSELNREWSSHIHWNTYRSLEEAIKGDTWGVLVPLGLAYNGRVYDALTNRLSLCKRLGMIESIDEMIREWY